MSGSPATDPRMQRVAHHGIRRTVQVAGQVYDEERFYQERDSRTQGSEPYVRPEVPVVVVLPALAAASVAGQAAFLWSASLLRRMGRPFAAVRLVVPARLQQEPSLLALHRHRGLRTFGEVVAYELTSADPFAQLLWRDIEDPAALTDAEFAIWIGTRPVTRSVARTLDLSLHVAGWVVQLEEREARVSDADDGTRAVAQHAGEPADGASLDAAPAAAILGAAFAVGAIYRNVQASGTAAREAPNSSAPPAAAGADASGGARDGRAAASAAEPLPSAHRSTSPDPSYGATGPLWYSADTGEVTMDATSGQSWMIRGSAVSDAAPWASTGAPVSIPSLVLVSAGGLGGNVAHVLADSHVRVALAALVDPDTVDVSNLNRLVGVGVHDVGTAKVVAAGQALAARGVRVSAIQGGYEPWVYDGQGPDARTLLDAPDTLVIVGADQVATRLEVQADWPALLLNGSTAGTTWKVSWHPRGVGGCLGCVYAADGRNYATTRGPQACAAGDGGQAGMPGSPAFVASYSFATVGAAAALAARAIYMAWERQTTVVAGDTNRRAGVSEVNAQYPAFARVIALDPRAGCRLLCSHAALHDFFGRGVGEGSDVTLAEPRATHPTSEDGGTHD